MATHRTHPIALSSLLALAPDVAAAKGELLLQPAPVVINCPIVQRAGQGALPKPVLPWPPA